MSRVTELRKSGRLEEAYRLAKSLHAERPNDIWVTRDFAWVLYDCMKRYRDETSPYYRNTDVYVISLRQVRGLRLGDDETVFFDQASKNLKNDVWDLKERGSVALSDLRLLLSEVVQWDSRSPLFLRKTISYLLKGLESDPNSVVALMSWWGLDKFREEDFERREVNDRKIWSFAEEATHRYLKALSAKDQYGNLRYDERYLSGVIATAKQLVADPRCENWEWPNKSLGDLLMAMGRDDEAAAFLATVVLEKPREPWAWHAFGKALERADHDACVSCLFKGLSLSRDTKMSLSLHEESMQLFDSQKLGQLAKAEAELIDSCRRENGWARSEPAARTLLVYKDVDAASPKKLRSEYSHRSRGAMECLAGHATVTELYLEWVDAKNRRAGIVTQEQVQRRERGVWALPIEPALKRKTVSLADRPSSFDAAVGEVWDGILDNKQRSLLAVLPHQGDSKIRRRVIREVVGALDLVVNEKTSKRTCFVRLPTSSPRGDDLFVPSTIANSVESMAGKLVRATERLVFRRNKVSEPGKDAPPAGKWCWEISSVRLAETEEGSLVAHDSQVEFYVERIVDSNMIQAATLSKQTTLGRTTRLAKPFVRLDICPMNHRYAETQIEAHNVYRAKVFGKTRRVIVGDVTEVQSGELWQKTVRPTATGIYEMSNGWGHIGCSDSASVPPREARGYSIEPGSTVTARLYRAFVRDSRKGASVTSKGSNNDGHWEWYAENISVVSPPEYREAEGVVSIAAGGFGFLEIENGFSCYITSAIVDDNRLANGDHITAEIRKSWDRKKSEDSWIVMRVESVS